MHILKKFKRSDRGNDGDKWQTDKNQKYIDYI